MVTCKFTKRISGGLYHTTEFETVNEYILWRLNHKGYVIYEYAIFDNQTKQKIKA